MKNIHILPTDKPSRLVKNNLGLIRVTDDFTQKDLDFIKAEFVNIYITSDEKIKEGDWMIRDNEQPIKVTKDFFWDFGVRYYKIILTTDQDLIKDGVQAIDDDFLEWFVKNPSCESVEVEMNQGRYFDYGGNVHITNAYKIIIPKEETKKVLTEEDIFNQKDIDAVTAYINRETSKQETLEEAAKRYSNNELSKLGFINGAKWQQERMYSKEDLKTAFLDGWQLRDGDLPFPKAKKKWFNEFKNK